ncbi:MAG: hypothetical protein CM1200mP25_3460 [Acidobacteriota bacterium]|nr:MAG: hypothetical protein CM1200mP25_3460 [Acidobacteriota bacterium]
MRHRDPRPGDGTPMFEVDPFWPKPMPNNWLLGSTIGVAVDSRDHVWVVHRGNLGANEMPAALDPPFAEECCHPAPPILEFDPEGNLSVIGVDQVKATIGLTQITVSRSTVWTMSGLVGTVELTRMC